LVLLPNILAYKVHGMSQSTAINVHQNDVGALMHKIADELFRMEEKRKS